MFEVGDEVEIVNAILNDAQKFIGCKAKVTKIRHDLVWSDSGNETCNLDIDNGYYNWNASWLIPTESIDISELFEVQNE